METKLRIKNKDLLEKDFFNKNPSFLFYLQHKLSQLCSKYGLGLNWDRNKDYCIEEYYLLTSKVILEFHQNDNETFIDFLEYLIHHKSLFPEGWTKDFKKEILSQIKIKKWNRNSKRNIR